MKFSQSTESAIDSLLYMAAHPEVKDFYVEDVARVQHISASYLSKVFQQLVKAGVMRSHRGSKGGYALAKEPKEITLLDIAQVIEGTSPMYECNAGMKSCTLTTRCLILSTFRDAEKAMQDVLRKVTLASLLENMKGHAHEASWVGLNEKVAAAQ